jgi:transcriptional regulator with AAA-type ATPase domain
MALLRDAPVSADVVAIEPVLLHEIPAESFQNSLSECTHLRNELLRRMAETINNITSEALDQFLRAATLDRLVRSDWTPAPLVAESQRMQNLVRQVQEVGELDDPVLVTGAAGTGKLFVARLVHEVHDFEASFFVVDCRSLVPEEASRFILGSDSGRAGEIGEGQIGTVHMAHEGTLVLRHVDRLPLATQAGIAAYVRQIAENEDAPLPRARILATIESDGSQQIDKIQLEEEFKRLLSEHVLTVPTLIQRRYDILPLARIFLDQARGERELGFTDAAEDALLSCSYSHRNAAELREAVETATVFADEEEIRPEHIFTGPRSEQALPEADLGRVSAIRSVWSAPWLLPAMRWGVLASFAAVILRCLLAGETIAGRLANASIWSLWEPVIIVLFLFVGHVWCTVCPLSSAGTLIQRLGSLGRSPPAWAKKYGGWFMLAGFFLIVWSERIFHMLERPFPSGVMLATLMGTSILCCIVYQREVWCRYLCPLGALATGYSTASTLHLRANPSVCASRCTTHECYKGTDEDTGCPVYHHPLYANEGHLCKLCLGCLDRCPYGSVKLFLRPPLAAVWRVGYAGATLVPFSVAVFLLALVLPASRTLNWASRPDGMTVLGLTAVLLGILLSMRLPRLLLREADPSSTVVTSVAFSLLVLGWGPLMAYQLGNIPALRWTFVAAKPELAPSSLLGGFEVSLLLLAQLGAIALATAFCSIAMWRIAKQARGRGTELHSTGWTALGSLCVIYVAAAISIVLLGGYAS